MSDASITPAFPNCRFSVRQNCHTEAVHLVLAAEVDREVLAEEDHGSVTRGNAPARSSDSNHRPSGSPRFEPSSSGSLQSSSLKNCWLGRCGPYCETHSTGRSSLTYEDGWVRPSLRTVAQEEMGCRRP